LVTGSIKTILTLLALFVGFPEFITIKWIYPGTGYGLGEIFDI
jgi:hypothetical protein